MANLELQGVLNRLANTQGFAAMAAANRYAGRLNTNRIELVAALNQVAGTKGLGMRAVCNRIAGTDDLDPVAALNKALFDMENSPPDSYTDTYSDSY